MTSQEVALVRLARFLESRQVPYMIIGGLANIVWGEPRATLDIDVTVWMADGEIPGFVETLDAELTPLVADPVAFIERTRVLPVESRGGVRVDVIFGLLPLEEEAIRRARPVVLGDQRVMFCAPEDLILMKIVSSRDRDVEDARGITMRRLPELDLEYLEPRISELASLLERPEIAARWRKWKQAGAPGAGATCQDPD